MGSGLCMWLVGVVAVCCVNADEMTMAPAHAHERTDAISTPTPMACEVCGVGDGEVERAFASQRFEACSVETPNRQLRCPTGFQACVTKLQSQGGKVVSKSCAERAVSGCHSINQNVYCYCTRPYCNTYIPKRRSDHITAPPAPTPTPIAHPHYHDDDEADDLEGSADDARPNHAPTLVSMPPQEASANAPIPRQVYVGSIILPVTIFIRAILS